ncbi:MAG: YdcF family protein [Candidatus Moranbacteria bacterium]|nr:YdcF family protein [Candidatus Moranbacteria bacterium]
MIKSKKITLIIAILIVIYLLPLQIITLTTKSKIIPTINQLPESDAIIIFGTVVRENKISPLLKQRLEAGEKIYHSSRERFQTVPHIVVSNTESTTKVMAEYYHNKNIPSDSIELDVQAEKTPDTCRYEKQQYPNGRKVIFVSQGFHLPRLLYQCKKLGVEGIAFPAEKLDNTNKSDYSLFTKITVRTERYFREAGLTWLAVLNIYK